MSSNAEPLQNIIAGCCKGDRSAQRKLYETYAGKMTAVCLRYCGDYETARDLMHDGFIRIFSHVAEYSGTGSFEGWMYKIFVNVALEFLRKNDCLRDSTDVTETYGLYNADADDPLAQLSAKEIMDMIMQLPDRQRVVFNLYAIEGYTHKEIAKLTHISEPTVRSIYARARIALRKMILERR